MLLELIGLRRGTSVLGSDGPIHDCANGEDKQCGERDVAHGNERKAEHPGTLQTFGMPALAFGKVLPHGLARSSRFGLGIVEEPTEMPPPRFDSLVELREIRSKHAVN